MKKLLRRVRSWVYSHNLVFCVQCHRLLFVKDARHEYTTTGVIATLCKDCDTALYHPFTGDAR